MSKPENRLADLEGKLREGAKAEDAHRKTEAGLQNALSYVESIVDTVREPLLVLDGKLCVITASHAFLQTFGVSREETQGQFLYDLGNGQWNIPALRTALKEVLQQEQSFQNFQVVHDFQTLGRRIMMLNARKLGGESNDTEHLLLAIEDVTERQRLEDELLRSNEDLERFAYVAAHDLRSPLNAALNLCKMLTRRLQGRLTADEAAMQELAVQSMERLGALMQDILTYSELTATSRPQTLVRVQECLEIALANLQHHIEQSGADITAGTMPEVTGDRTQIAMVFQNLIGNALKYRSEAAPRIHIEAVHENGNWRLSVSDNGQGFKPEFATLIFEPFKRLHGQNISGSGIGLATCKRIVDRMNGRIWAESIPGEGSTFYFTLPVKPKTKSV